MHTKWEKMTQLVNRRHSALDENRRRSSKFSENISELNYFILEKSGAIEMDKKQLDPRQAKQALQKHQKTEEEIKINERVFDEGKSILKLWSHNYENFGKNYFKRRNSYSKK